MHLPHADVQYLHFAQPLPKEIEEQLEPDLTIVNYDFLNYRFSPLWPYMKNRFRGIARRSSKLVAIAQDDFWAHRLLDNWCRSWQVDRVLTPIENHLDVLYPWASQHVEFRTVLTGYAPTSVPSLLPLAERPIDLGQRVRTMPAHLGRYAQEKSDQAVRFAHHARTEGFRVDVSTNVEDSILGDDWLKFLASCRFTVGMKGGASIADPYGRLYVRADSLRRRDPNAGVRTEDIRWLRRRDGRYQFSAISPRLLEAAATKTCQVLRRDNYLDVLTEWEDFLPLDDNFGNVNDVLQAMQDLDRCTEIADNAHKKLIASARFSANHLIYAAVTGLLNPTSRELDSAWNALLEFEQRINRVAYELNTELHDSTLHLVHETANEQHSRTPFAIQTILNRLSGAGYEDWFHELKSRSLSDPLFIRSPWIWRPVPTSRDE
jgi:hypothetical protein